MSKKPPYFDKSSLSAGSRASTYLNLWLRVYRSAKLKLNEANKALSTSKIYRIFCWFAILMVLIVLGALTVILFLLSIFAGSSGAKAKSHSRKSTYTYWDEDFNAEPLDTNQHTCPVDRIWDQSPHHYYDNDPPPPFS